MNIKSSLKWFALSATIGANAHAGIGNALSAWEHKAMMQQNQIDLVLRIFNV